MTVRNVTDISYVHPRVRQQDAVDMLKALLEKADAGELVGALVIYVDNKGDWHHKRDMFNCDMPTLLGYLEVIKMNLAHRFLTGETLTPDQADPLA